MRNKKCPLGVYCECDCNTCTDEDKKEKISRVVEALLPVIENLYAAIVPLICSVAASVIQARHNIMCLYPYKKIVHLALYHPKKRVRKKNETRILKWLTAYQKNSSKKFSLETEWEKIEPEGYFPAWKCTKCGNIIIEEDECISLPDCKKCTDGKRKSKVFFDESYHEAGGSNEDAEQV